MNFRKAFSISKILAAALVVGLIAGGLLFSYNSEQAALKIERLETQNQVLLRENAHIRFVVDMAKEFSINPYVVELVDEQARRYVDPSQPEWRLVQTPEFMTHIMLSVIYAESKGRPNAVGDGGRARGLTQIWVSTAQQYGEVTEEELLNPATNIDFAFQHFRHLLQRYRGNLALALYSWNRGQGTVDRLLSYGQPPTNGFGVKVYRAAMETSKKLDSGD